MKNFNKGFTTLEKTTNFVGGRIPYGVDGSFMPPSAHAVSPLRDKSRNGVRKRSSLTGFTLVEVLVVTVILIVAVLSLWAVFITSLNCINQAKEMNIAADDLKDVLEKIKSVAFSDITTVFPDGGVVSSDIIGGFLLNNEAITVTYPQGIADPLEIEVAITWTGRDQRPYSKTFRTIRTSML